MCANQSFTSPSNSRRRRLTSRPILFWELQSFFRGGMRSRWKQPRFTLRREGSTLFPTSWTSFQSTSSRGNGGHMIARAFTWLANRHTQLPTPTSPGVCAGASFWLQKWCFCVFGNTCKKHHLLFIVPSKIAFFEFYKKDVKNNAYIDIDNGNLLL